MTETRRIFAVVVAAALLSGCPVGPNVESVGPAARPQGTALSVTYSQDARESIANGELVAVRESGLLVLAPEGLTLFNYTAISQANFTEVLGGDQLRGSPPSEEERARVARFARYPFGITDTQLDLLLEALGQDRLEVVTP